MQDLVLSCLYFPSVVRLSARAQVDVVGTLPGGTSQPSLFAECHSADLGELCFVLSQRDLGLNSLFY